MQSGLKGQHCVPRARAICGLLVLAVSCLLCGATATARSLTVDDTLALETIVDAKPSPDGRYVLLIKTLSSAVRTDFSQDLILGPKSGQLLEVNLNDPGKVIPLMDVAGETYALGPYSPDSRRVLVYAFTNRHVVPNKASCQSSA